MGVSTVSAIVAALLLMRASSAYVPPSRSHDYSIPLISVYTGGDQSIFRATETVPPTGTSLSAVRRRRLGGLLPPACSSFLDDESFREVPEKGVIEFVQSFYGEEIIASDLAARAGIPLSRARRDLATLAALTGAGMAVTQGGELVYTFPSDLPGKLRSTSLRYRVRALAGRAWPGVFYCIRVSFGAALMISLLAIFATIAALSSGSAAGDEGDDNEDRRQRVGQRYADSDRKSRRPYGGGINVNLFGPSPFESIWGPSPLDIFYYRPYYGRYRHRGRSPSLYGTYTINPWGGGPVVESRDDGLKGKNEIGDKAQMSFLEAIFSYVFGDGDPNFELNQRLLSAAATAIRENGGAVTAEQLAPFLPVPPSPDRTDRDEWGVTVNLDESYVLPIVTKLSGEPVVTDDGDILYMFPEMVQTTNYKSSSGITELSEWDDVRRAVTRVDEAIVQEQRIDFSLAGGGQRAAVAALGIVNLLGALSLGKALRKPGVSGLKLVGLYGLVQRFYPLLLSYALLYNVIPMVRAILLRRRNERIKERNSNRRRWVTKLKSAGGSILRKLHAARGLSQQVRRVGDKPIIFDTNEGAIDRKKRWSQKELEEYDAFLNEDD